MLRTALVLIFCSLVSIIFAQNDKLLLRSMDISGQQRTRLFVIEREIPIHPGDSLLTGSIENLKKQIVRNLTNTGLFNFIEVAFTSEDSIHLDCAIQVEERWYIWPGLLFSLAETNINSWWENKDFERINYGVSIIDYNFRGRKEKLTFNFQGGWKRKFGLTYQVPFINRKKTLGAGIEIFYANNREVNLSSTDNKRDWLKSSGFIQEEYVANAKLEWRPGYLITHRLTAGIQQVHVRDSVLIVNPRYLPAASKEILFPYLSYGFKREARDNRAYPLRGYVVDGSLDHRGMGIKSSSGLALTEAAITVNMHHHLHGRWYFAHGLKGKTTISGTPPYYFQRAIGYSNNNLRGYELYVIDGQHYLLYKSNLKFELLKKHIADLNANVFRKFEKFHYSIFLNLFADAGYAVDRINPTTNPMANKWQYSYGLGVDLVTYYDLVFRFELSLNAANEFNKFPNVKNPI